MEEELILKYLSGRCSEKEEEALFEWIGRDEANVKIFTDIKNLYVSQTLPDDKASDSEYDDFLRKARRSAGSPRRDGGGRGGRHFGWIGYSAAAVILVLLALNLTFMLTRKPAIPEMPVATLASDKVNTLYVPKGVKGKVVLPDSSEVWLNSDSRISYPARFSGATREVEFSGEGYFKVRKDSLVPMFVRCSRGFRVEVLGTEFNIKSYDNDDYAEATLYSGLIRLVENIDGKDVVINIRPNESYVLADRRMPVAKREDNVRLASAWKEGKMIFEGTPFTEVVKVLERWHGVDIDVENHEMDGKLITARFGNESLTQIMDLLKFSTGISYEIGDSLVVIK